MHYTLCTCKILFFKLPARAHFIASLSRCMYTRNKDNEPFALLFRSLDAKFIPIILEF